MKKLLYITVNSKPEELSTSKTVGRKFVNSFLIHNPDYELIELDLYNEYIPEMNYKHFTGRAELVAGLDYEALSEEDKKAVDRMNELSEQFLMADTYVIAAPMWSLSFPAKLKSYLDCIILNNKLIKVSPKKVEGLLNDKDRSMVYIQSSGGDYPPIFLSRIIPGVEYCREIFKFLGVKKFEKLLVEGVDMPKIGREIAIEKAYDEIDSIIKKISKKPLLV